MRKAFSLILASLLVTVVGAAVLAQTHNNMTEKKATDEVTLSSDVLVGTHLLKAGRYEISCDAKVIKFSSLTSVPGSLADYRTKVLEVPCQGQELPAKRQHTELSMPTNKAGVRYLEKLYLRGSNIEHVFPN
jgi:hypothetical protein